MKELKEIRKEISRISYAISAVPELSFNLIRHGILPLIPSVIQTIQEESLKDVPQREIGKFLARTLNHSGPVLIKLGQILATRNDILPKAICEELEILYDQQPAMSKSELSRILESQFGENLPFEFTDETPMAVGSIGEVYSGTLSDESKVVIKVIRPGILKKIQRDIHFLETVLDLFNMRFGIWDRNVEIGFRRSLEELAKGLQQESDLRIEAAALKDFRKRFRKNSKVYVPYCYDRFSGKNVLIMEKLEGQPLSKVRTKAKRNKKLSKQLAELALTEILKQIFEEGRFHADPHGGNLLLLEDGRLGIIDLGLTGHFGETERKRIVRAIRAFVARDVDSVISSLLEFGETPDEFDLEKFRSDVAKVVSNHKADLTQGLRGKAKKSKSKKTANKTTSNSLEQFVNELFLVAYKHKIYVPQNSVLLVKTLVTIEGLARSIDPDLNLVDQAVPIVLRAMLPKWLRWPSQYAWNRTKSY